LTSTEAGTQKKLAVYVVRGPEEVPGVARLGLDPFDEAFTPAASPDAPRGAAADQGVLRDQSCWAGIGNAYSDEILHAARMSPSSWRRRSPTRGRPALRGDRYGDTGRGVERARGLPLRTSRPRRRAGCAYTAARRGPARCAATPSARCPSAIRAPVLPHLPDRRQNRSPTAGCHAFSVGLLN